MTAYQYIFLVGMRWRQYLDLVGAGDAAKAAAAAPAPGIAPNPNLGNAVDFCAPVVGFEVAPFEDAAVEFVLIPVSFARFAAAASLRSFSSASSRCLS